MTIRDEAQAAGARLVPHSANCAASAWRSIARFGGVSDFGSRFWITIGHDICYPSSALPDPWAHETTIRHELVHVRQGVNAWWIARYLASQDFRWRQEREAYLVNVRAGESSDGIAEILSVAYRISKPTRQQMIDWFEARR